MKAKTHKALSKRVRFTSTGVIQYKPAGASHLRVNKSPRTTVRRTASAADASRVRKMLPNG